MKGLLCLLLIIPLAFEAWSGEIKGRVYDADTGAPLAGASVLVEGTSLGTAADAEGEFSLRGVPAEEFVLSAGFVGYKVKKIRVGSGRGEIVNLALVPVYLQGEEVTITASRADLAAAPVSFSNISREEVKEAYYGQELPLLLEETPGLYSYSDAGNPQGYSYLKIRGFDQKRVSVFINGIPLNDPEDHQVYWVDMPDLAANIADIQVQRGLGYSPYGPSAFGGSVNILTSPGPEERRMETSFGYGSFNTRKFSALFNSGIVDNTYQFYGRFSRITTDGYRDNSGFEGWSYYLSAAKYGVNHTLTVNLYGGPEFLHAAWDAAPEDSLKTNRKYNPISYPNTVDNFNQPHYELHHNLELSENLTFHNTLFYIKGRGYWEMYKADRNLRGYGLTDVDTLYSDLVTQKWVDKHQWGWLPRLEYQDGRWEIIGGGNFNQFNSQHWGKVIWVENPPAGSQPEHTNHDYDGDRSEGSIFIHASHLFKERLKLLADVQFRHLNIEFRQNPAGAFAGEELNRYKVTHNFLNPKIGASYRIREFTTAYASAGFAQREPSDNEYWDAWDGPDDFEVDPLFAKSDTVWTGSNAQYVRWSNPLVKPEKAAEIEIGIRHRGEKFRGSVNLYWMDFRNEIIYGGGVSDGYPITGNADKTLHRGVEMEAELNPLRSLAVYGNMSYSRNTFESNDILGLDPSYNPVPIKGNTVPLFPELMLRGRLSYDLRRLQGWSVKPSLGLAYIGEQYLESTNLKGAVIDPYWTADLRLSLELPSKPGLPTVNIHAVVDNLFDSEYETSGYYYLGNYYYPGASRSYYVDLRVRL